MSFISKREAHQEGERWRKKMPKGWKLRVWENIGWHWELRKGNASVSPLSWGSKGFHALISEAGQNSGGSGYWTSQSSPKSGKNPMEAVKNAVGHMKDCLIELRGMFYEAEKMADKAMEGL